MNKQQIMALILTAVIGISSCVTAPGISAFASEEETISASESVQGQNTDEISTDTFKQVEVIPDDTDRGAVTTEAGETNPSTEGEPVSTVRSGAEEASEAGSTDLNTSGEDSGEEETDSDPEMAVEGQTAATSEEATEAAAVEKPTGETTDETELAVDAKKLTASDPGGSFETAVDIHVNGTCTFTLEDHGEYYLKFTPTESGIHTIYATSSYKYAIADCYLLGSADAQDELAFDQKDFLRDDDKIFFISQELTAGHTYYLLVGNGDVAFDMELHVERPSFYARACDVAYTQTVGKEVTLKVDAGSALPLTFEWHKKNGTLIPDAVTDTYTFTPVVVGDRTFTCTVSDGQNTKTVTFHFYVSDYVSLTAVNENVTADYGSQVTLQTSVDSPFASKLTYQWRDANGKDIKGAVDANYTVNVTKNTTYSCKVTSPYGAYDLVYFTVKVNSYLHAYVDNAGLDGNGLPQKKAHFNLDSQEPITLSVVTDSTDQTGLTYQWYKMAEDGSDSYPSMVRKKLDGKTSKSLHLDVPEAGTYICTVKDTYDNSDSASFDLQICSGLTVYPEGAETAGDGKENYVYLDADTADQVSLNTVVKGSNLSEAKYRWYVGDFKDPAWTAVSGGKQAAAADSVISSLSVSGKPEKSVRYKCVVQDACGNYGVSYFYIINNNLKVSSPNGTLSFDGYYKYKTTVTKEMEEPCTLKVDVAADYTEGLDYGWFYFAPGSNTATILTGNSNQYRVTAEKPGFYECRFSDRRGNSRCVEFKVVIGTGFKAYPDGAPMVDGRYADRVKVLCEEGEEATLTVKASSSESWEISYKWFDPNGNEMTAVGDRRTAKVTPDGNGTYVCKVDDGYGNVLPVYFDIVLDNELSIVPVNSASASYDEIRNELTYTDVAQGASVKLRSRVTADDASGLRYVWYERELYNQSGWTRIDSANSGILTVKPSYDTQYSCMVTDRFGTMKTAYFVVKLADTKDLGIAQIILSRSIYVCDWTAREPIVAVRYKGETLQNGVDYAVTYENNVKAGTATVTISAVDQGRYTGSKSKSFTIRKASQNIKIGKHANRLLVGGKTKITVSDVKQSAKVSFRSSDKTVATIDQKGNVTAKKQGATVISITTEETGDYAKTVKNVTISVVPGAPTRFSATNWKEGVHLSWSKVPGATKYNIYRNGTIIRTLIQRANSLRDIGLVYKKYTTSLTNGTFYNYMIQAENEAGKSTKVRYAASLWLEPMKITSASNHSAGKVLLKLVKNSAATGYKIEYTYGKNFNSGVKTITTKSNYPQVTIKKLTKGKTYQFRVCSYRVYKGKTYYSTWSDVKKVKVKK